LPEPSLWLMLKWSGKPVVIQHLLFSNHSDKEMCQTNVCSPILCYGFHLDTFLLSPLISYGYQIQSDYYIRPPSLLNHRLCWSPQIADALACCTGRSRFMSGLHSWKSHTNQNCANRKQSFHLKQCNSWGLADWQTYPVWIFIETQSYTTYTWVI